MHKLIIASLLVIATFAAPINYAEVSSLWSLWKDQYSKTYSFGEEAARFAIFTENVKKIQKNNAENNGVRFALNAFADLTSQEFKDQHASCAHVETNKDLVQSMTEEVQVRDLPASVDWRTKGVVTPVKDQQQCGSCWSFSTTGVLEGFYALANKKLLSFSEQQIVDCDKKNFGCEGGWPYKALEYAAIDGLEQEDAYPYTAQDGQCTFDRSKATKINTGYKFVTPKSADALKTAIVGAPVSILIEADQDVFQLYSSGVISSGCGATIDHAVLAVGYDTFSGTEAYIVKNSWGESWGQKGYVYIATDASPNAGLGVCGILTQPVLAK